MGVEVVSRLLCAAFIMVLIIGCSDGNNGVTPGETLPVGENWRIEESGTTSSLFGIAWSGEQYVAVGRRWIWGSPDTGLVFVSTDGVLWDSVALFHGGSLLNVLWSGDQFVAVGHDIGCDSCSSVRLSNDGRIWRVPAYIESEITYLEHVAYSGAKFVAVGGNAQIASSMDGEQWVQEVPRSDTRYLMAIAWTGKEFISVGYQQPSWGAMVTALTAICSDGMDWSFNVLDTIGHRIHLSSVVWTGQRYVAVGGRNRETHGSEGVILISSDGVSWTRIILNTDVYRLQTVSICNGTILAAGDGGAMLTSRDGVEWTLQETGVTRTLYDIAFADDKAIAVGDGGAILSSRLR